MKLPAFLRGMPQVARQEFTTNLKSVRLIVMALLFCLLIGGGSFGFSSLFTSGMFGGPPPVVAWGHPAFAANGSHVAVVWVSDPYGAPMSGRSVTFTNRTPGGGELLLGTVQTDASGFARLDVGSTDFVSASVQIGTFLSYTGAAFTGPVENFTVDALTGDYFRTGRSDGLALHVLDRSGNPVAANVSVNDTKVGSLNSYGFILVTLPVGPSTVSIEVAGEVQTFPEYVLDTGTGLPLASGPDLVLALIASLAAFLTTIFAIIVTFDSVSKERVQGTMDLLLSRPSSRTGILLGKFLGAFGAVALPVTLVNLLGIAAITAVSGKAPTGGFAIAFVGACLLLIAYFVLIQLIFSSYAKTSGTAILFGFLAFILLFLMYSFITSMIGGALFGSDPAAYYRFQQVAGLLNPSTVCSLIVALAEPPGLVGTSGTALDPSVVGVAAVVWFVVLLALALWSFHRKAAE